MDLMLTFTEIANTGMTDAQATALGTSLQTFGGMILDNFIKLLPAVCILASIFFVINIVRKKVKA